MAFIGQFVNVFDTYLIAPLVRQISILKSSSANFSGMETEVRKLTAKRKDEENKLKTAEDARQVKTEQASNWFEDVKAIEEEADAIRNEYSQGMCVRGWCVNCWSRYRSSKRSMVLKQKAESTLKDQFVLARPPPLKPGIERETEPIENQPSTQHMLQQLLDRMVEPEIEILGLYGMGGVGKTTLAKQVNNHFSDNSCFEKVIMVTVSATPNVPSIQTTIGKRLGLDLSNAAEDDAREKLYDALKKKKFLLILDDVWDQSTVELEKIGIPHPRNQKGSKILITSRSQDACTDMGAKETIKVRPLSEVESWNLFLQKAGDHVAADGIRCFAEKIVERCEGLPLAIVTVAHAMANRRGVGEWANAEREMKESITEIRGIKDKVLILLKFSFDRLEDDMLRSLFLYCACCFSEDYYIWPDDILDYCVGEGLIDRLGSLIATRNKSEALIGSLKIACMLEDVEYEGCVRMHDMMRELALWITSTSESDGSPKFLLTTDESCKEAPQPKEWVEATKISLLYTQIKEFPELGERCQNLTTLLLRENSNLTVIPTNFFQHMDHLSVFYLSHSIKLESLPDSLSCLENLRVLRLNSCRNLKALPALGRLRRLQVLQLWDCESLEQQIFGSECVGVVSNLRCLELGFTKVSIPTGVISRLVEVEDLKLWDVNNIKWSVKAENEINEERRSVFSSDDESHDQQVSSSSSINEFIDVGELSNLTRLRSLEICFDSIIISDWFKPLTKTITELKLNNCRFRKQDVIIQALNESQCLDHITFKSCTGLTCVPTLFKGSHLEINECEDLEKLLDGAEAYQDSFQRLKRLILERLPKLERICVGLAPINCFAPLFGLYIYHCNRLKMVFTKEMPRHFNNLSVIEVDNCNEMEVIIETTKEEEDERGFVMEGSSNNGRVISPFPKLKQLWLVNLPALADVCNNHILHCPLLNDVKVWKCPRLNKNPLHICDTDGLLVIEDEVEGKWKGEVLEEEIQEMKGEKMGRYYLEARKVAIQIIGAIPEFLGLGPTYLSGKLDAGMQVMAVNCYPSCPQADIALGLPLDSDYNCITILLKSCPGLQVMDPEDGTWKLVQELQGVPQVHIGDHFEVVLCNGLYKNVVHRVILNSQRNRGSTLQAFIAWIWMKRWNAMNNLSIKNIQEHTRKQLQRFPRFSYC